MIRLASAIVGVMLVMTPATVHASNRSATSADRPYQVTLEPIGAGDADGNNADRLVLTYKQTGARRILLVSRHDGDHTKNLTGLSDPVFSLDGGFLYLNSSDVSPYRSVVHQINLKTGAIRFVTGGWAISCIRTGPYRGFLLVQKHLTIDRPEGGTYNPVFVIRPDGHREFMVPGSDNDDGEQAVAPWLASKGWHAW